MTFMSTLPPSWVLCISVGLLWGCTNPFIKRAQERMTLESGKSAIVEAGNDSAKIGSSNAAATGGQNAQNEKTDTLKSSSSNDVKSNPSTIETLRRILNPAVFVPFAINQTGSAVFFVLLATEPVTIVAPVCNSLTFVITAVTGYFLGEEIHSPLLLLIGVVLIGIGIGICVSSA